MNQRPKPPTPDSEQNSPLNPNRPPEPYQEPEKLYKRINYPTLFMNQKGRYPKFEDIWVFGSHLQETKN